MSKEKEEHEMLLDSGMKLKDIGEGFNKDRIVVSKDIVSMMVLADSMDFVYRFSIGYKTREKLGDRMGESRVLMEREWQFVKEAVGKEMFIGFDVDMYYDLCVWQYLYNISETIMKKVQRQWKSAKWKNGSGSRWVKLELRKNYGGRKKGSQGRNVKMRDIDLEPEEEFRERIAHNKKVGVLKGFLAWYLDACREECERDRIKWTKVLQKQKTDEYKKLRSELG